MDKLEQVQKLVETFKLERIIYVSLTSVSAVALITIGIICAANKDYTMFLAMLVPTGTLTLCIFRVLKMWDDALKYLSTENDKDDDK